MHKHPHHEHRAHHVEKRRVSHILGHHPKMRARGGKASHPDEAEDRALIKKMLDERLPAGKRAKHRRDRVARKRGGKVKHRDDGGKVDYAAQSGGEFGQQQTSDRPDKDYAAQTRARGGKVGKKGGKTNVTVNVMGHHGMPSAGPAMAPPPMMPPAPPAPPPMPPGGPVAGLGGPAPGMMPPRKRGGRVATGPTESNSETYACGGRARKSGGRLYSDGHTAKEPSERELKGRAKGGGVKSGPAWEEGKRLGTQPQPSEALSVTRKNMDRGRAITFKAGGKVVSFRASGGAVESSQKVVKGMTGVGGGGGGVGRREKARHYAVGKPMRGENQAR